MTTASDLMNPGAESVGEHDTLVEAARKLSELDVASLPICGPDGNLLGILTEHAIVRSLAEGADPNSATAGGLADGKPATIDADGSVEDAIETMVAWEVRELPVVDDEKLVGMLSLDDLVSALPPEMVADLLDESSS